MRKYVFLTMMLLCAYNAQAQSCGENCSYTLTADGLLTIFPTDPSAEAVIKDYAFYQRKDIKNVVIQEGITSTEQYVFANSSLLSVELPKSLVSLGTATFQNTQLTTVQLPSNLEKLGAQVFRKTLLTNIELPNSLTYLGQYSLADTNIQELYIPDNVKSFYTRIFTPEDAQRGAKVYCSQNNQKCLAIKEDNTQFSGIVPWRYTKNADGGVYLYDEKGKLKTIKGKKIYTVEEAEAVTANGDKFRVRLTYK